MWVILYATLWISLLVLYRDWFTGGYPRDYGDKWFKWWAEKLVDAVRMHYTVNNPDNLKLEPGKRYMVMSNHRSHFDIPLIAFIVPGSVRMLGKKELFKVPIWGRAMRHGEFISIDRSDLEQAKKDLAFAREKLESGIVLWISPEGTRSRTGKLGPFKKGGIRIAIESGATIIPMGIQGTENVLKPKTLDFFLDQDVTINVGTPIEASRFDIDHRDELLEELRASIAELCGEA